MPGLAAPLSIAASHEPVRWGAARRRREDQLTSAPAGANSASKAASANVAEPSDTQPRTKETPSKGRVPGIIAESMEPAAYSTHRYVEGS